MKHRKSKIESDRQIGNIDVITENMIVDVFHFLDEKGNTADCESERFGR